MNPTVLALVVVALMAGGGLAARALTRRVSRDNERKVVLMASVTAWVILFGLLPLFVFALYARRVGAAGGPPSGWAALALNLIPFALVASPVVGFAHGMRASRTRRAGQ